MAYSRAAKKPGAMKDYKFKEILSTMAEGLNPVKPAAFFRTLGQSGFENFIDYSTVTRIKLCQEFTQSLPVKLNITEGEVNQFN